MVKVTGWQLTAGSYWVCGWALTCTGIGCCCVHECFFALFLYNARSNVTGQASRSAAVAGPQAPQVIGVLFAAVDPSHVHIVFLVTQHAGVCWHALEGQGVSRCSKQFPTALKYCRRRG